MIRATCNKHILPKEMCIKHIYSLNRPKITLGLYRPPEGTRPCRVERVEFEYRCGGTLAYFATYDVDRAQVVVFLAPKTGIVPFMGLVGQVMCPEP